jgi:hypothetical protein
MIRRQLRRTGHPTLMTLGAFYFKNGRRYACRHTVVAVAIETNEITVLDPLGRPPARLSEGNASFLRAKRGDSGWKARGCIYEIDASSAMTVLTWDKLPVCNSIHEVDNHACQSKRRRNVGDLRPRH